MEALSEGQLAALAGLFGGIMLGMASRIGRFCTLGAIEDYLYGDSDLRMRMWIVALAVAIIGSFALVATGHLDPTESMYLSLAFNPTASIVGGAMFGYGMALSGNCGFGALARFGGGDLRAFVIVLIMAVSAYMAIAGPTAVLREWIFPTQALESETPSFAYLVSDMLGFSPAVVGIATGGLVLGLALQSAQFRKDRIKIFWGSIVGLSVVSGWYATSFIASTGFGEVSVVTHTFAAPVGESLIYLMTSSGSSMNFGIGSVSGVVIGALISSYSKGQFRWEACEDSRELRRQIFGAFLLGTGAVTALGCSIGQGLSAFSVLSFSAPLVLISIFAGAALGLRQLILGPIRNQI